MCYTYDVRVIVMICKLQENNKEKCANYWQANLEKYQIIQINGDLTLEEGLIGREFDIKNLKDNKYKKVFQIQLYTWDDHSAPITNYNKIIKMVRFVDKYRNDFPVVVHCSAGVGRTGTFISMYNLYHEIIEQIKDPNVQEIKFSIMNLVRKLKEMRMLLVENEIQYILLYQFVNQILIDYNKAV